VKAAMPSASIRRPVSVSVWLVLSALALALSPLLLAVAELVALLSGDRRLPIMTRVFIAYFARELTTLLACGAIWLLCGGGALIGSRRIQRLHWRLLQWFVGGIAASVLNALQIGIAQEPGSEAAAAALRADGPLIVLSRHAGPADTVLLIDRLLTHFDRQPSVVFKEAIVLDPSIDLLSHRLPHAVLDVDDPPECEAHIARTAAALGPRGALLLFPEGGNFTFERRRAALRALRRRGQWAAARAGERMEHVLPPRPSGTVAALRGCPTADVVFAAHTGLGLAAYPLAIWRELPVGRTLRTRMWLVSRTDIPDGEEEVAAWLNDWWGRIDDWIDGQGQEG
jgi:1-acyl-sn-glycerol-3-phosphate acyltransferase